MLNWNCTKEDTLIIAEIAQRAHLEARGAGIDYSVRDCLLDINAAHCNGCPLDLVGLLASADSDFNHDVFGIRRHINRETGKLEDGFTPRYARQTRTKAEITAELNKVVDASLKHTTMHFWGFPQLTGEAHKQSEQKMKDYETKEKQLRKELREAKD